MSVNNNNNIYLVSLQVLLNVEETSYNYDGDSGKTCVRNLECYSLIQTNK